MESFPTKVTHYGGKHLLYLDATIGVKKCNPCNRKLILKLLLNMNSTLDILRRTLIYVLEDLKVTHVLCMRN